MTDGDSVPKWAAELAVSVAKIEARTDQIPRIAEELEKLRANSVPMSEHAALMQRVDVLWAHDLAGQPAWSEMTTKFGQLWDQMQVNLPVFLTEVLPEHRKLMDDRARIRGGIAVIGLVQALVTTYLLLEAAHIL